MNTTREREPAAFIERRSCKTKRGEFSRWCEKDGTNEFLEHFYLSSKEQRQTIEKRSRRTDKELFKFTKDLFFIFAP